MFINDTSGEIKKENQNQDGVPEFGTTVQVPKWFSKFPIFYPILFSLLLELPPRVFRERGGR